MLRFTKRVCQLTGKIIRTLHIVGVIQLQSQRLPNRHIFRIDENYIGTHLRHFDVHDGNCSAHTSDILVRRIWCDDARTTIDTMNWVGAIRGIGYRS